jgi:chemotaxis protein MotB
MGGRSNAPVIIKRKKVIAGGGHHGGAWKVAMCLVLFVGGAFCAGVFRDRPRAGPDGSSF